MKHVRKIFAFAVALFMAFAVALPAFAQTVGTAAEGKGSITINNAAKGEEYSVVKIFDAKLSDDKSGISYTYDGAIPGALSTYFEKDSTGNVVKKSTATNDAAIVAAVQEYAKTQNATATATSDGSSLTFQGLPYGYYAVISTQGTVVTVDSTNPNATIYDKNTKTVSAEKTANNGTSYSIGDQVNFTATFNAPNYLSPEENANEDGSDARQVVKYVISDTLPEFLSDVQVDSIKVIYKSGDTTSELDDVTIQFSNKSLTIPWADKDPNTNPATYTSKYKNGAQIVVSYHGTLTSTVNINAANTNKVTITPHVVKPGGTTEEPEPWSKTWSDTAEIKTYGAALKKVDGETQNALKGAKFKVKGLTVAAVEGEAGVYKVVEYDATSTTLGTEMSTNNDGQLYIIGLANNVTLKATETEAPNGYNKLREDETVDITSQVLNNTIYETSGTRYYDADGNLVSQSSSTTTTKNVEKNYTDLITNATVVENNKGTEMPSTGGIGTTIFYVVGGVMVAGAVVFLLTKRRVNAE